MKGPVRKESFLWFFFTVFLKSHVRGNEDHFCVLVCVSGGGALWVSFFSKRSWDLKGTEFSDLKKINNFS